MLNQADLPPLPNKEEVWLRLVAVVPDQFLFII
jgi:hypothetical protein